MAKLKNIIIDNVKILDIIYPIGSIYLSVKPDNPQTIIGGAWEPWGQGRVPVGVGDNGDTNYTIPEQVGGSENSIASHNHSQNAHTHIQPAHAHRLWSSSGDVWSSNVISLSQSSNQARYIGAVQKNGTAGGAGYFNTSVDGAQWVENSTPIINASIATNIASGELGGNRQPFITCYMWKRTG